MASLIKDLSVSYHKEGEIPELPKLKFPKTRQNLIFSFDLSATGPKKLTDENNSRRLQGANSSLTTKRFYSQQSSRKTSNKINSSEWLEKPGVSTSDSYAHKSPTRRRLRSSPNSSIEFVSSPVSNSLLKSSPKKERPNKRILDLTDELKAKKLDNERQNKFKDKYEHEFTEKPKSSEQKFDFQKKCKAVAGPLSTPPFSRFNTVNRAKLIMNLAGAQMEQVNSVSRHGVKQSEIYSKSSDKRKNEIEITRSDDGKRHRNTMSALNENDKFYEIHSFGKVGT